ncbi:cobalamin B12-binding domain-containing protein [Alicyclobacillus tolerans]|uniref:cobalamin B12-binding domain-containing protein n=1 Tax=Alicyclobacillus tolerans TaxID=90970 RepID=UPI003B7E975B
MNGDVEQLSKALLEGNRVTAWALLRRYANDIGDSLGVYDYLTQTMRWIGQLWMENEITVADEHLATGICDYILSQYAYYHLADNRYAHQTVRNQRAMFFCVEGESHYLGLKMVRLLFQEAGYETVFLGTQIPLAETIEYAKQFQPSIIGISASMSYHLPSVVKAVEAFHSLKTLEKFKIIVGGRLIQQIADDVSRFSHCLLFHNLKEVQHWLENDANSSLRPRLG